MDHPPRAIGRKPWLTRNRLADRGYAPGRRGRERASGAKRSATKPNDFNPACALR